MINYKVAGFNTLNEMFNEMLNKQESGDHVGFIRMSSMLSTNQKVSFIDYSKGHKVFAGAMKDLVTESCGDYRVGKDYADYIKYALNRGGYIITSNPNDCYCSVDNWAYPEVYFTDGQLIEGCVRLFQKEVSLKAVDAKERIYNKSITYFNDEDLLESINHFKHDIEETFNETPVPEITTDAKVEKKSDIDDPEWAKNELELFIKNDGDIYFQSIIPIIKNLAKKKQKGVYDPELAIKLWYYCVQNGYKKYRDTYNSEFKLSVQDRRDVAKSLRDYYDESVDEYVNDMFGPQTKDEELKDEQLDKDASSLSKSDDDILLLSKYLKVDPDNISTDGETFHVTNDTKTYKISDTPLDLSKQGYTGEMFDNKYVYWR